MNPLQAELQRASAALLASEAWAANYANAPDQHAKMIKQATKFQRLTLQWLKDTAAKAGQLINWYAYARAVIDQQAALKADTGIQAYDVNVIVNNDAANAQDQAFIQIVFDTVATIQALGADSMAEEFGVDVGLASTSEIIQSLTTAQLANLVGMKIDKATGRLIPNPNPVYQISETTRERIARSIQTSIRLGENQTQAAARLSDIIADPARADMIAYTETVRAYAEGRKAYASQAGLGAKKWDDTNATDVCADNTAQGWIPFDEDFVSGDENEPAHPNCRCQVIYSNDKADLADAGIDTGEADMTDEGDTPE